MPVPPVVLVYSFAVTPTEVIENKSLIHHLIVSREPTPPEERARVIGKEAAEAMADELVRGISELGLPAKRAYNDTNIPSNAVTIHGAFLDIDQGNQTKRLVVGFGSGASRVDTTVYLFQVNRGTDQKLLEFETHADSGKTPGAVFTMGAGPAAEGEVTSGIAAYQTPHEQMAARSAGQAVAYISQFFARESWIAPEKAKKVSYGAN